MTRSVPKRSTPARHLRCPRQPLHVAEQNDNADMRSVPAARGQRHEAGHSARHLRRVSLEGQRSLQAFQQSGHTTDVFETAGMSVTHIPTCREVSDDQATLRNGSSLTRS